MLIATKLEGPMVCGSAGARLSRPDNHTPRSISV